MYSHYTTSAAFTKYCINRHHAVTRGYFDAERRRLKLFWTTRHNMRGPMARQEIRDLLSRLKWLRKCVHTEQSLISQVTQ